MATTLSPADRAAEVHAWLRSGRAREIREHAGVSRALIAQSVNVSEPTVWRWETCQRLPIGRNAVELHRLLSRLAGKVTAA